MLRRRVTPIIIAVALCAVAASPALAAKKPNTEQARKGCLLFASIETGSHSDQESFDLSLKMRKAFKKSNVPEPIAAVNMDGPGVSKAIWNYCTKKFSDVAEIKNIPEPNAFD